MPANVTFDLTLPHSYSVIALAELPGDGQHPPIYFPGVTTTGGKDGLFLRFTLSNGKQWSGCFAFGRYGLCGVFAVPDPDCVCVVSKGTGYWVYVNEPEKSSQMPVVPIRDVRVVPTHELFCLRISHLCLLSVPRVNSGNTACAGPI